METLSFKTANFCLFGMRRSGNHVFADWLKAHGTSWKHYNNCFIGSQINTGQADGPNDADNILATFEDARYFNTIRDLDAKNVILILRDPYNLFSSRLKMIRSRPAELDMICLDAFKIWKDNAKAFLSEKPICISFNKWFSDKTYRRQTSEKLGFEFTDEGFGSKAGWKFSGGSSFGGEPDPMNSYFKNMSDDQEFLSMFDEEIQGLAKNIFGVDPPEGMRYDQVWNEGVEKAVNHVLKAVYFKEQPVTPTYQEAIEMYPASSRIKQLEAFFLPR